MDRARLKSSWDTTSKHLTAARALLPLVPIASDDGATLENFEQFLEHNELGLALDELAGVGLKNGASVAFWKLLKLAAENMHLPDQDEIDRELRKHEV
jgi:hypothetical protein